MLLQVLEVLPINVLNISLGQFFLQCVLYNNVRCFILFYLWHCVNANTNIENTVTLGFSVCSMLGTFSEAPEAYCSDQVALKHFTISQRCRTVNRSFNPSQGPAHQKQKYFNLEQLLLRHIMHMDMSLWHVSVMSHCIWLVFIITVMLERGKHTDVLQEMCGMEIKTYSTGERIKRSLSNHHIFAFLQVFVGVFLWSINAFFQMLPWFLIIQWHTFTLKSRSPV